MYIGVLNESLRDTRVAVTPKAVQQYRKLGFSVLCEEGAYVRAGFTREALIEAGATVLTQEAILQKAELLLFISMPPSSLLEQVLAHACIIAPIDKDPQNEFLQKACANKVSVFSMNAIPRISRAQAMDSLSSQANIAGYKAVIEAAALYESVFPMMMTAAGMIHPANVLVLGAGVAGLQAIATAKRLGAVVYAFDVRAAAKEQVESVGATFIEIGMEDRETERGYAEILEKIEQERQNAIIEAYAAKADIIIATALIPGKKAPQLLSEKAVALMKPGSVIVDLASKYGGNCALTVADKRLQYQGITIVGDTNMAGLLAKTASELYANNLLAAVRLLVPEVGSFAWNREDEIVQQALLCHEGAYLPFQGVA